MNTDKFMRATDIALIMGGEQITSDSVFVESFNISWPCPEPVYYYGKSKPIDFIDPKGPIRISLELVCTELTNIFNPKKPKQIRYKKVEDCSIEELLFAVREISKKKIENESQTEI